MECSARGKKINKSQPNTAPVKVRKGIRSQEEWPKARSVSGGEPKGTHI